jgi:type VI secretion system protein ImpL
MRAIRSLLSVLRARWFWSLVGAVILSLLIWFFGDLLGFGETRPLEGPVARLVDILVIAVLWGAWNLLAQARARRSNDQLVSALAEPAAKGGPGSAELAELERRFAGALEQLKRSRLGKKGSRRWLYELPWYAMIGPPGSGKSTALAQSGLRLRLGQIQELRGVGGTRYCDWVFTDDAVLLDTAGRYTTQDSDPTADKSAWLGFLDLLKERRPRHPLNGILIALASRDLLQEGGFDHAAHIRARLEEIETRLGMRLPVYLLVTKADLVAGFEPFFGDFNEKEREQVWGHTFDHQPGRSEAPEPAELREALGALVARLDRRVPERLAAESDVGRRALIFGFPAQVSGLAEEIVRFAERCFRPTTYEPGAWLRGVYLTSGTQTGTPIDRLMAAVARNIGVSAAAPLAAAVGGDRSFFLRRLLEQVIFGEASLAGRDLARERRDRLLRSAAFASLALVAAGAIGAWGWSFAGNRDRQLRIEGELQAWSQTARPFARTRLTAADADFTAVLPLLDKLGDLKTDSEQDDPIGLRMGLSQRPTAEAQLSVAYRAALANLLLPRLVLATEGGLRTRLRDPDYVVEALKIYLSLAGSAPVDPGLLEEYFALQAEGRPGQATAASARRHVAALISILPEVDPGRRPALDARLVTDAQTALARVPLPRRAYAVLVSNPAVAKLPGWKATDHAGPTAAAILVRRSGRPLGTELPAIFTYDGFHQVFLPQLDEVARGVYAEYWVLSGRGTPDASDADIRRLKADMLRLYYDDAIAAWDGLLRDVALAPIDTLNQAVESTKALSGPSSPLKLLIQAVVRETALTVPPEPPRAEGQGAAGAASAALNAARGASRSFDKLARLVRSGSAAAAAPAEVPGAPVEARFAHLRPLIESVNNAPPALDDAASALAALHTRLAEAAASPNPGEAFARMGGSGAPQLAAAAARLPEPAKQMLEGVGRRTTDMGRTGARQQLNAVWRTDVLPFCRTAIAGRFPFSPGSGADATTDDIARLFGPSGLIEGFIKGQLANFVDTTRQPWRDSQNVGLQAGSLAQLARARRITAALFPSGAGFKASFNLTPVSLSSTAAAATLDVDGQELRYAHGPARPTAFTWPGPSGANTVRLSFAPTGGEPPATMVKEGPWALFRVLNEGRLQRTEQPDVFEVEVGAGGHSLRLRLRAASVENPFDLRVLSGFACPENL